MKTDGGPAFPVVFGDSAYSGMTLRQWYAGMAMQALNTNPSWDVISCESIAEDAFRQADAMLSQEADDGSA